MSLHERHERVREYVSSLRDSVLSLEAQKKAALTAAKTYESEYKDAFSEAQVMAEAAAILAQYADHRQAQVRERLEGLVTAGLQQVFEEDLEFHIRTKTVGNQRVDTYMTLTSTHDGTQIETSIMDARGGGVAAVAGFLLRVVSILLLGAPKFLVLDESFAQVSADYEARLSEFLSELVESTGFQILMVTHSSAYEDNSDAVYRTSQKNGKTILTKVS